MGIKYTPDKKFKSLSFKQMNMPLTRNDSKHFIIKAVFAQLLMFSVLSYPIYLILKIFISENLVFLTYILSFLLINGYTKNVPISYRKGKKHMIAGQYDFAIIEFRKSVKFFEKRPWIDSNRYFFFFTISRESFLERSMYNIGLCCFASRQVDQAIEQFGKVLSLFPYSRLAMNALEFINIARSNPVEAGQQAGSSD